MRIAHITPHVGGGVGAVLQSFFELAIHFGLINDLYCLDKCETNLQNFTKVSFKKDSVAFDSEGSFVGCLRNYDVILIHYWNHPLLAMFLVTARLPACRLVIWSHNSGLFEPHVIPTYLVHMANKVLFTSGCSFNAPNLLSLIKLNPAKFDSVHSTRVLDEFKMPDRLRQLKDGPKNLLYVGTVSKSKMHPSTGEIFANLSKLGFCVRVVGGPDHEQLRSEVSSFGGHIEVYGAVTNVADFYKRADLFIYPLRGGHYGTGEQVILEAMAAGLPVVAFNNPAEAAIIQNDETGYLAYSSEEFVEKVVMILSDPKCYRRMSRGAIDRVDDEFDARLMAEKLIGHMNSVTLFEKKVPSFPLNGRSNCSDLEILAINSFFDESIANQVRSNVNYSVEIVFEKIASLLDDANTYETWQASTKSSPNHYLRYFPYSSELQRLVQMVRSHRMARKNPGYVEKQY